VSGDQKSVPASIARACSCWPAQSTTYCSTRCRFPCSSGVRNIIIVTGRGKSAIEDHFDVSFELEHLLEARGQLDLVASVRSISDMIDVAYVRQ